MMGAVLVSAFEVETKACCFSSDFCISYVEASFPIFLLIDAIPV
jgi:hypothetical protein